MGTKWTDLEIFNPILAKARADSKDEAIQLYFQQLWQMDNLVILLGAGFSKHASGPVMTDLSREVLPSVILEGLARPGLSKRASEQWLALWGIDAKLAALIRDPSKSSPALDDHCATLNIEQKIGSLHVLAMAARTLSSDHALYDDAMSAIRTRMVTRIAGITPQRKGPTLPHDGRALQPYRDFLKRLVSFRRPQQPRIRFFTLNYDLVVETACDLEGIHCVTGFGGKNYRILNPTLFDLDVAFKATGQTSVYFADVLHLYKLHGSIDWHLVDVDGSPEVIQDRNDGDEIVIYPCYTKFAQALELPYYEMFRHFGAAVSQPQTVLLTLGYGFGDDHVNQMIRRAYKNPSCQILACEPALKRGTPPANSFLSALLTLAEPADPTAAVDPRLALLGGDMARFPAVLDVLFQPRTIDDPVDQIRGLLRRLLELGKS